MIDDATEIQFAPSDPDVVWEHYLESCRRDGVTPMSRKQALGLMQEWGEVLSGRPEPTEH